MKGKTAESRRVLFQTIIADASSVALQKRRRQYSGIDPHTSIHLRLLSLLHNFSCFNFLLALCGRHEEESVSIVRRVKIKGKHHDEHFSFVYSFLLHSRKRKYLEAHRNLGCQENSTLLICRHAALRARKASPSPSGKHVGVSTQVSRWSRGSRW